jgi:hypothetical protein
MRKGRLIETLILLLLIPILVMFFLGINFGNVIIMVICQIIFGWLVLDALVAKPGFAEGPEI